MTGRSVKRIKQNHCSSELEYLQAFWLIFSISELKKNPGWIFPLLPCPYLAVLFSTIWVTNFLSGSSPTACHPLQEKGAQGRKATQSRGSLQKSALALSTHSKFLFTTLTVWRAGERSTWSFLPPTTHLDTAMQSTRVPLHNFLSNSKCLFLVLLGHASVSPAHVSRLMPSAVQLFTFHLSPPPCHLLVYCIYKHYTPTLHVIPLVIEYSSGWWQPRHNMLRLCLHPKMKSQPTWNTQGLAGWGLEQVEGVPAIPEVGMIRSWRCFPSQAMLWTSVNTSFAGHQGGQPLLLPRS